MLPIEIKDVVQVNRHTHPRKYDANILGARYLLGVMNTDLNNPISFGSSEILLRGTTEPSSDSIHHNLVLVLAWTPLPKLKSAYM